MTVDELVEINRGLSILFPDKETFGDLRGQTWETGTDELGKTYLISAYKNLGDKVPRSALREVTGVHLRHIHAYERAIMKIAHALL